MKLSRIIALSMVLLVSLQVAGQGDDDNYAKGLNLYFTGHYQLAADALTKSIDKNPGNALAHLYRGNCNAYLHRFKEAEKDFKAASKKLNNNAELCFGYGYLYNEKNEYQKAIPWLDKAILLRPKYALAFNTRGVSYQSLGKIKAAIENYTDAIRADSTLAVAYNNRGTAVYENQDIASATNFDIKTAIKDFDIALKLDPSLCVARRNRGLAYSFIKKYDLALIDMDDALKCDETNVTYYINRGTLLTDMGEYDRALADFKQALFYDPKQPEILIAMGETKHKAGNTQDAVVDEMKAGLMDKRYNALSNYNIARFYASDKDKILTMKYLGLAKKAGYFRLASNVADFLKAGEFLAFKTDPDFQKFRNSVRKN